MPSLPPHLLLLLFLPLTAATADFCDSDPRLSITTHSCLSNISPRLLLRLPLLDQNPFHALHDYLWAVSHYLQHCTSGHHPTLLLPVPPVTSADCLAENPAQAAYWGVCATVALAMHVVADVVQEAGDCFDTEVTFGGKAAQGFGDLREDFRGLSWFGRGCVADGRGECVPEGMRSGLVALPERYKAAAMAGVREAVMRLVGEPLRREGAGQGRVRVLLYDRNDTQRRQWANAGDVYERLRKDERIEVRFVRSTPPGLGEQVRLYAWADVLVAPHGAAMVNSLFLRPGAEIVEMWQRCDNNIARDRWVPHDWTGWHASLLDVNVQYVQCHRLMGPYKEPSQLLDGKHGPPTNGPHKVRIEEMFELLDSAIARQEIRFRVLRGEFEPERKVGSDVKNMLYSFAGKGGMKVASRVSLFVLVPACTTLLAIWSISNRRKVITKRCVADRV